MIEFVHEYLVNGGNVALLSKITIKLGKRLSRLVDYLKKLRENLSAVNINSIEHNFLGKIYINFASTFYLLTKDLI
jgi:hypothetical protein